MRLIIPGLMLSFLSVFFAYLSMLGIIKFINSFEQPAYSLIVISLLFFSTSIWFGLISYRLLFNKPRNDGGLFSPIFLIFAVTALLGISIVLLLDSIQDGDILDILKSTIMFCICISGYFVIYSRVRKKNE